MSPSTALRRCFQPPRALLGSASSPVRTYPRRSFATKPSPLPTVPTCPSPTCGCAATPAMPEGLDIDRTTPLNGAITGYAEHVLVCTGRDDWPSRIEEENSGDNLAADLKELFGRGGRLSDPFHNISVLNASFPSSVSPRPEIQSTSAYLLPSFKYVPFLPRVSFDSVEALARGYLLPDKLHSAHDGLSPVHRDRLLRKEAYQSLLPGVQDVKDVLVLICGHGGRDMRCGVMAPVLEREFEEKLEREGLTVATGPVPVGTTAAATIEGDISEKEGATARIGRISHIGGHKYAGNVIIYLPPGMKAEEGKTHPLAGHGIWYGRVEPAHVEGIVRETIMQGNIIADMFRGGINADRQIILPPDKDHAHFPLAEDGPGKPPSCLRGAGLGHSTVADWEPAVDEMSPCEHDVAFATRAGSIFVVAGSLLGGVAYYLLSPSSDATCLNDTTFVPYTITARESVSATSFVFTVSPRHPNPSLSYLLPLSRNWRYPLWSVEFKQPEVQIARHYTPLPPLRSEDALDGSLRFYVRSVGDGEMSSYLGRLGVGNQVWLRGPHAGFDLLGRLGACAHVVFLAGGTGVVPGLQAASAVLDQRSDTKVTLLWAVRSRQELQAAQRTPRPWWPLRKGVKPLVLGETLEAASPVGRQLQEMKTRYHDRLTIHVAISEEDARFDDKAIFKALTARPVHKAVKYDSTGCRLHDQGLHNQVSEFESLGAGCACPAPAGVIPGKNLFIVCGPDGFISHYAGPKVWLGGQQTQGPIGGVAARLREQHPALARDWLVLKL
ncbi:hypothetical protein S40293_03573 [Stachybotrys chartarum IBT 40293]|nr:hypothetical protein S40293_03573 [Stachybotrys chartarum IBT 40293]